MDSHPQRELSGPQLPSQSTGAVISTEIGGIIELSIKVIEKTDAAPSCSADWGMMASPMGPLPEPQVGKNLFEQGPSFLVLTNSTAKTVELARPPLTPTIPFATHGDQALRGTARGSAYYSS